MFDASTPARGPSRLWFPFAHEIVKSRTWSRLSKIAKAVYPVIAAFADFKTGENAFPSIQTITRYSGVARSSVFRALEELTDMGLVEITQKGGVASPNRYRISLWPGSMGGPMAGPPGPTVGPASSDSDTGGGPMNGEPLVRPSNPTYSPVIINQVTTTTTTDGRRRRGSSVPDGGGKENIEQIEKTLGLKGISAKVQLQELVERFTLSWTEEACEEAVAQGRPTLKYLSGILKNWERTGRITRKSQSEEARDLERERMEKAQEEAAAKRREYEEAQRRAEEGRRAFELVEAKIKELPARELTLLQAQGEVEADQGRIPPMTRGFWVQSFIRQRVAERCGIRLA